MDERYTYGYLNGWDVENEYINSIKHIMNPYNEQYKKIYGEEIEEKVAPVKYYSATDEQLKEWYESDVNDRSIISFERYKKDILDEINRKNEVLRKAEEERLKPKGIIKNSDEYFANLYYLIQIKEDTRKEIYKEKKSLELLLTEKKLELSSINLEQRKLSIQYDENRNILNSNELIALRKRYDDTWLEIKKIEHALNELDAMSNLMELTKEEIDLLMRGLNPQQRKIYDDIEKKDRESIEQVVGKESEKDFVEQSKSTDVSIPTKEEPSKEITGPTESMGGSIPVEEEAENKVEPVLDLEEEELVKVTKVTPWQWVKGHKKQILIALGLTALAVALILLVTQVLPALVAAQQAAQTAGLMSQMMANGSAWFTASVGEQAALHGANTALANLIASSTGLASSFNVSTGVWTIGGKVLSEAAALAASKAAATSAALASLKGATLIAGLGGIGTLGAGLLTAKRTDDYKKINTELKELKQNIDTMGDQEFELAIQNINNEINNSKNLTANEKSVLLKRLRTIARKRVKIVEKDQDFEVENINEIEDNVNDFPPNIQVAEFDDNGDIMLSNEAKAL